MELPVFRSLQEALASGRLSRAPGNEQLDSFIVEPDLPEDAAAMFERTDDGKCVFLESGSGLCVIHRDLGESALAATCRHYPRLAVHDGRGTQVGLSHYCPTAAGMLFRDDVPLEIVTAPPAFPPADYEGLEVTDDDLPPLLRPGVVMDLDAYDAWERHMVTRCVTAESAESAVATLMRDARLVRAWTPDGPSMEQLIATLPSECVAAPAHESLDASLVFHRRAMAVVPDELRPVPDEHGLDDAYRAHVRPHWDAWSAPLRHYLAAKAFANWTAYQGHGLLSIITGLEAALALVRVEAARQCRDAGLSEAAAAGQYFAAAPRAGRPLDQPQLLAAFQQADFILNHLAVGEELALDWSKAELHAP